METNNLNPVYDVSYFIRKFEAIPEDQWCRGNYEENGSHCAYGHCGVNNGNAMPNEMPKEARLMGSLFNVINSTVVYVNDGTDIRYQQHTPKQRILAALHDIKMKGTPPEPPVKVLTKYVSVPESISQQVKETILS